jgi:hypothetical protein
VISIQESTKVGWFKSRLLSEGFEGCQVRSEELFGVYVRIGNHRPAPPADVAGFNLVAPLASQWRDWHSIVASADQEAIAEAISGKCLTCTQRATLPYTSLNVEMLQLQGIWRFF